MLPWMGKPSTCAAGCTFYDYFGQLQKYVRGGHFYAMWKVARSGALQTDFLCLKLQCLHICYLLSCMLQAKGCRALSGFSHQTHGKSISGSLSGKWQHRSLNTISHFISQETWMRGLGRRRITPQAPQNWLCPLCPLKQHGYTQELGHTCTARNGHSFFSNTHCYSTIWGSGLKKETETNTLGPL